MRAMLDELMGKERNLPPDERTGKGISYKDAEICKYALAGLCPYGLFKNTKSDLGRRNSMIKLPLLSNSISKEIAQYVSTVLKKASSMSYRSYVFPRVKLMNPCCSGLCKYEVHEDDVEFPPAKEEWDKLEDNQKERYAVHFSSVKASIFVYTPCRVSSLHCSKLLGADICLVVRKQWQYKLLLGTGRQAQAPET